MKTIVASDGIIVAARRITDAIPMLQHDQPDAIVIASSALSKNQLPHLARVLLQTGVAFVAIIGSAAKSWHEMLDEELSATHMAAPMPATTWHDDESADDVFNMIVQVLSSERVVGDQPKTIVVVLGDRCQAVPGSFAEVIQALDGE